MERYTYSFTVWPDNTRCFERNVYVLFATLNTRIEFAFTDSGFDNFRASLASFGLTLRKIERVPFHEPETVL